MQYAEYKVATKLNDLLKDCSVFVPSSSQEKGIDLLLYRRSGNVNRCVTIQVKSSRTYFSTAPKRRFDNFLWLNRFTPQKNADLFILTGIYPMLPQTSKDIRCDSVHWDNVMLLYTYDEMVEFLEGIRLKRNPEEHDKMFCFGFDRPTEIYLTRGSPGIVNVSDKLLAKRLDLLADMIER